MGMSVKKASALVEMVRAFDKDDKKRAKKIENVIQASIQKDALKNKYGVIELKRQEKELFPQKIREKVKYADKQPNGVEIRMDDGNYVIEISNKMVKIVKP